MKIKRGDTVEIIGGREKGHRGEVLRVLPKDDRIVVQGANLRKKHQRQVQAGGRQMNPGIIQFEASMHVSNVMLVCPKCDELVRVSVIREDGERRRVCKQCEAVIDS
ncbi:MAG: 50S ribosomal protein L24 [Anaerolineales bacterium]|nr:50S ribosomal protein L24 [Anaerolineales bacterium]